MTVTADAYRAEPAALRWGVYLRSRAALGFIVGVILSEKVLLDERAR